MVLNHNFIASKNRSRPSIGCADFLVVKHVTDTQSWSQFTLNMNNLTTPSVQ